MNGYGFVLQTYQATVGQLSTRLIVNSTIVNSYSIFPYHWASREKQFDIFVQNKMFGLWNCIFFYMGFRFITNENKRKAFAVWVHERCTLYIASKQSDIVILIFVEMDNLKPYGMCVNHKNIFFPLRYTSVLLLILLKIPIIRWPNLLLWHPHWLYIQGLFTDVFHRNIFINVLSFYEIEAAMLCVFAVVYHNASWQL